MSVDRLIEPDSASLVWRVYQSLDGKKSRERGALSVVAYLMPFAASFGGRAFDEAIGPHVLCIVFSLLAFPMTLSLVGNYYVRQLFFRVYLPLKLER